jgi:hypothetical protein
MDVSYERNVTTLLTTIISNAITITLLGVYKSIKQDTYTHEELSWESGTIAPSWLSYIDSFFDTLINPIQLVEDTALALCNLIIGMSVGMPFKYIRLLSDASYFIGYNPQDVVDEDKQGVVDEDKQDEREENANLHIDDSQTDVDDDSLESGSLVVVLENYEDSAQAQLPKVWLPKYWPKKVKEKNDLRLLYPPPEKFVSDAGFDEFYSVKSSLGCLFGAVQCVSAIVISCIRLQNIDTVHTMDVLSMYTSYMLLCTVIGVSFDPAYYCKPVVCIPIKQLERYTTIGSRLSFRNLRLCIHSFFSLRRGRMLVSILLVAPICLMTALLIYINKNSLLLLSLSTIWIFVTALGSLLLLVPLIFSVIPTDIFATVHMVVTLGLLITLIVYSCLNATVEQKYPSSANWLPHF